MPVLSHTNLLSERHLLFCASQDGQGSGAFGSSRSAGQIVMGVTIKLVVDMWLSAGPAASLPLALLLLQRAYGSKQPTLRRRAFDLLANLVVPAQSACVFRIDTHPQPRWQSCIMEFQQS